MAFDVSTLNSPAGVGVVAFGATQVAKKIGISGDWLAVVCVLAGGFASFMINFEPAAWANLAGLLVGVATTGGVSFLYDLLPQRSAQ